MFTALTQPAELVGRAIAFGLLGRRHRRHRDRRRLVGVVHRRRGSVRWAGLVVSVLTLLDKGQPASWRASRPVALGLATLSVAAIVVAIVVV